MSSVSGGPSCCLNTTTASEMVTEGLGLSGLHLPASGALADLSKI